MHLTDDVDEAMIDFDVAGLARMQIDYAWRSLCATMLLTAAHSFRSRSLSVEHRESRAVTRDWIATGGGVVTFSEACETAGISQEKILSLLNASNRFMAPIKVGRSHAHARSCRKDCDADAVLARRGPVAACGCASPRPSAGDCCCGTVQVPGDQDGGSVRRRACGEVAGRDRDTGWRGVG